MIRPLKRFASLQLRSRLPRNQRQRKMKKLKVMTTSRFLNLVIKKSLQTTSTSKLMYDPTAWNIEVLKYCEGVKNYEKVKNS